MEASRFAWEKRAFDRFSADVTASGREVAIQNGSLSRGTLQGTFCGSTGLRNWAIANDQPIQANAQMRSADVRDLLALAAEPTIPAAGKVNASLGVNGTVGNPIGNVSVAASDGNVYGESFQSLDLQADLTDRLARLTRADWIGPAGAIQANGTYSHPRDMTLAGDLRIQGASNQVRIGAISNATQRHPGIDGTAQLTLAGEATIARKEERRNSCLPRFEATCGLTIGTMQRKTMGVYPHAPTLAVRH